MSEQFNTFIKQLSETNATLDYFTDFQKIKQNVNKVSIKLCQLNYLIGKADLKTAIEELFNYDPKAFDVLDILIAVRKNKDSKILDNNSEVVLLSSYFETSEKIFDFFEETGLRDIFQNKNITNLVDYVFGVEVGLDSNARKNRGGENMSKAVSLQFDKENVFYKKEINITEFPQITSLGVDLKRFDFVIKTNFKTYLIETNFYNGGGSKLNEVARAYSDLAPKINKYSEFEFVWITDGKGWESAKNKLEEAYSIIPNLYNLTTLIDFIKKIKKEGIIQF